MISSSRVGRRFPSIRYLPSPSTASLSPSTSPTADAHAPCCATRYTRSRRSGRQCTSACWSPLRVEVRRRRRRRRRTQRRRRRRHGDDGEEAGCGWMAEGLAEGLVVEDSVEAIGVDERRRPQGVAEAEGGGWRMVSKEAGAVGERKRTTMGTAADGAATADGAASSRRGA